MKKIYFTVTGKSAVTEIIDEIDTASNNSQ